MRAAGFVLAALAVLCVVGGAWVAAHPYLFTGRYFEFTIDEVQVGAPAQNSPDGWLHVRIAYHTRCSGRVAITMNKRVDADIDGDDCEANVGSWPRASSGAWSLGYVEPVPSTGTVRAFTQAELDGGIVIERGRTYRLIPGEQLLIWRVERDAHVFERWLKVFPE